MTENQIKQKCIFFMASNDYQQRQGYVSWASASLRRRSVPPTCCHCPGAWTGPSAGRTRTGHRRIPSAGHRCAWRCARPGWCRGASSACHPACPRTRTRTRSGGAAATVSVVRCLTFQNSDCTLWEVEMPAIVIPSWEKNKYKIIWFVFEVPFIHLLHQYV